MAITVTPTEFSLVQFHADEIAAIAERLRDEIGLPADLDITIEVDETSPTGRFATTSLRPLHITVEGGAFENPKKIRTLSETNTIDVLGLLFLQARDRLDAAFGGPELDADLSLAHRVAWEVSGVGRLERLGHPVQRARRLYHFRNRHGFTDAADAAFDRLWSGEATTWAAIVAISDDAVAAQVPSVRT